MFGEDLAKRFLSENSNVEHKLYKATHTTGSAFCKRKSHRCVVPTRNTYFTQNLMSASNES